MPGNGEPAARHHHRTVDRVTSILELVASSKDGLMLRDLSRALDAPKTSVLQLLGGLVATGYLAEHKRNYTLGTGPLLLALSSNAPNLARIRHSDLVALNAETGLSVQVGVRLGENFVAVDHAGLNSQADFHAWNRTRRPLLSTATGKIILANLADEELHRVLQAAGATNADGVNRFFDELPDIRRRELAYNRGSTIPGAFAIATAAFDATGGFVAAVCLTGSNEIEARFEKVGALLIERVRSWKIAREWRH